MKKIITLSLLLFFVFSSNSFADTKHIDLRWTSHGLQIKSPTIQRQTRIVKSEYYQLQRMPNRAINQSFRKLDRKINSKIRK